MTAPTTLAAFQPGPHRNDLVDIGEDTHVVISTPLRVAEPERLAS